MGCRSISAEYQEKLETISKGKLDKRAVETIKMNTYCKVYYNLVEERELYFLFERFLKLNPNESNCIANNQLLCMPEFKYCALKKQLSRALLLELDAENTIKEVILEENDEKKEEDAILNVKENEDEINKTEKLTLKENEVKEELKLDKNEKQEMSGTKDNLKGKEEKIKDEKPQELKIVTGEEKSDEEIITPIGKQYIDFRKFCDIMKIFNPRTPIDSKVNCNLINKLVYFRMYDVDNDGRISKGDFRKILIDLVPEDMLKEDKVSLKDEAKEHVEKIINLMFKEIVGNEKRKFIEYDEFQKILWQTNIDKTCVIHFETI